MKTLILGCGNYLFGDDGFGYFVIKKLENLNLKDVEILDVGSSGAYYLIGLTDEEIKNIKKIIVVDAIDFNLKPGEIKFVDIDELPNLKKYSFDSHDVQLAPFLKELAKKGVEIKIIGCQVKEIPIPYIKPGLSKEVEKSVDKAVKRILKEIGGE
ncbi:coenzyme F420-reducing hydrogenase, FrhD protein [Methanocaldococcus sp.]